MILISPYTLFKRWNESVTEQILHHKLYFTSDKSYCISLQTKFTLCLWLRRNLKSYSQFAVDRDYYTLINSTFRNSPRLLNNKNASINQHQKIKVENCVEEHKKKKMRSNYNNFFKHSINFIVLKLKVWRLNVLVLSL